ncbi:Baeyer-Villiger monooxygenase [Mycobacterium simulans]|nr:Baeyer-Villiger monooxygenase [Mycobacterium simulans]
MTDSPRHIVIVGARETAGPLAADLVLANRDVLGSAFDDATDTWVLTTSGGETVRARVVIATKPAVYVPWIPDIPGVFAGESFHAAAWDPDFDPADKRIAVIGTDAAVGHRIGRLVESARSVAAFAYAPRRFVTEVSLPTTRAKRWLRRHVRRERPPALHLVRSAIDAMTSSGVRASDGVEHRVDAIVYGTGYTVGDQALVGSGGLTIRQAWADGMEPFFGVAVHGFPNYFFITGPDIGAQARYIVKCMELMGRTASTRMEVRRSSQHVFNERAQLEPAEPQPVASAFDLSASAPEDDDTYDGAATLEIAGIRQSVRVRLAGHLDPIDGNYHWQGTVFDQLPQVKQARAATLSVGEHSAPARIIEETPWGTHSVAGVGTPPYARRCP